MATNPNKSFDIRPAESLRDREKPEPRPNEKNPLPEGLKFKFPSLPALRPRGKFWLFGAAILLLFLVFLHLNVSAEIEIWPKKENQVAVAEVKIDAQVPEANFASKTLLGFVFTREDEISQEFSATGVSEVNQRASGRLRVYNNYSLLQVLVENTRFLSAEGKLFRSTKSVTVPAGGDLEVPVTAAESGSSYNIKPTTFSIPGLVGSPRYTQVYAKSFSAMSGGLEGKTTQVSQTDLSRAQEELENKLGQELRRELEEISGTVLTLLVSGIEEEILENSSSHAAGEATERFTLTMKMKARGLSFRNSDLEALGEKVILAELDAGKKIWPESFKMDWSLQEIDWKEEKAILRLEVSSQVYPEIDLISLEKAFLGKSLSATNALLVSYPEIEKFKISLWPFWRKSIPDNLDRVEIKLNLD